MVEAGQGQVLGVGCSLASFHSTGVGTVEGAMETRTVNECVLESQERWKSRARCVRCGEAELEV